VGSVVAMGIAIAVPYYQAKIARDDQQAEREKERAERQKQREGLLTMILPDLIKLHGWVKGGRRLL
jgi:hypothetical protein